MNAALAERHEAMLSRLEVPFSRTPEEVWEALSGRMQDRPVKVVRLSSSRILALAAALVVLLLGTYLVVRYYSVSVISSSGQQLSHNLPGGSAVMLNAGTEMKYFPLWWRFSRIVTLDGEAYFEVEPGKTFEVRSDNGRTTVLGTSFNIYARSDGYRVDCLTGKVRVTAPSREAVVIGPEYQAVIGSDGKITVRRESSTQGPISWTEGRFTFASVPLRRVLDEIERQFTVRIRYEGPADLRYTGFFSRDKSVEEVLELVCKPFGFNFVRNPEGDFEIKH